MIDHKILIPLDCLFDTLLGTVMSLDINQVMPLIQGGYFQRNHDNLALINPALNQEQIKELYAKRDLPLLKLSRRTYLVSLLAQHVAETTHGDPDHPQALNRIFTINTYPYNLPKADLKALFVGLQEALGTTQVNRVHIPVNEITPVYLKENYDRFFLRNVDEWFDAVGSQLRDCPISTVTCVAPLCLREGYELEEADLNEVKRWITTGFTMYGHLDLELIPLLDVSVHVPKEI